MHAWYPGYLYLAGREDEMTDGLNYEYLQCKSFTEGALLPSLQGLATLHIHGCNLAWQCPATC